jgi:ankyrin repeat protein
MEREAIELLDLLVKAGADMEALDDSKWTPLVTAINEGVVALVEAVIERGARLDKKDASGGTVLHFLAGLGRLEEPDLLPLADLLVKKNVDRTVKNAEGLTAAEVAEKRGCKKLASVLAP